MTYDYVCTNCGHGWEAEQRISEAPLTQCPACDQATAKRQISGGAGFILKGGGWYSDGYASKSADKPKAEPAKSDAKPKASSDGSGSGSDSKPKATDKSGAAAA